MGSKKETLDEMDRLYRLGRKQIELVQNKYYEILNKFPETIEILYNRSCNPFEQKTGLNDPEFLQRLAEDSAIKSCPDFKILLMKLKDEWYGPTIALLEKVGIRNYILRFEEGETRRTIGRDIVSKDTPNEFDEIGDELFEFECQLVSLREIIEDYESREQAEEKTKKATSVIDDDIVAIFSFGKDYSLCINGKSIRSFQIGNSIGDDFKNAFNNSGKPIVCKSKSDNIKSTINSLSVPLEVRRVFARQSNGKLIVNRTVRKSDLIKDFVDESRIEEIIKELSERNSSKK